MTFKNKLKSKEFIITCELAPPKGYDTDSIVKIAQSLKGLVHAINITDGQGGNMRMNSVIASYLLQRETGIEAICQMVCRDKNSIAIQAEVLGALGLKIHNYLILKGDSAKWGDNPMAKDVFEFSTDDVLEVFKRFTNGFDFANNHIEKQITNDICLACATHPGVEDLTSQAEKMKARIENYGIEFFQTQIVYDIEQLKRFKDSLIKQEIYTPIFIGITPLKSVKMANFMNEKIYGVTVPKDLINRLENSKDQRQEGLEIASELFEEIKNLEFRGIHLMPIGQEKHCEEILKKIKNS